jgi:hypothetical protein
MGASLQNLKSCKSGAGFSNLRMSPNRQLPKVLRPGTSPDLHPYTSVPGSCSFILTVRW